MIHTKIVTSIPNFLPLEIDEPLPIPQPPALPVIKRPVRFALVVHVLIIHPRIRPEAELVDLVLVRGFLISVPAVGLRAEILPVSVVVLLLFRPVGAHAVPLDLAVSQAPNVLRGFCAVMARDVQLVRVYPLPFVAKTFAAVS